MTLTWLPPSSPRPRRTGKQTVVVIPDNGGAQSRSVVGPTASSFSGSLLNGFRFSLTVLACQTDTCPADSPQTTRTTRIDATPPSGRCRSTPARPRRTTGPSPSTFAATDPLIGGAPGTSSGVTEAAIDIDGDGITPASCSATRPTQRLRGALRPDGVRHPDRGRRGEDRQGQLRRRGPRQHRALREPLLHTAPHWPHPGQCVGARHRHDPARHREAGRHRDPGPLHRRARGAAVRFDATSPSTRGAAASGVDPATATWAFKDGTPTATGAKVAHVFTRTGTFVGELRVRTGRQPLQRPRLLGDGRPGPGAAASAGSLGGVTGSARFQIDRLKVRARYVRSRLSGSIALHGSLRPPGALRAEFRRRAAAPCWPGRGPAPPRGAVRADGEAADAPRPRHLPGRVRRPGRDPGRASRCARRARASSGPGASKLSRGRAVALFRMAAQPVRSCAGGSSSPGRRAPQAGLRSRSRPAR